MPNCLSLVEILGQSRAVLVLTEASVVVPNKDRSNRIDQCHLATRIVKETVNTRQGLSS